MYIGDRRIVSFPSDFYMNVQYAWIKFTHILIHVSLSSVSLLISALVLWTCCQYRPERSWQNMKLQTLILQNVKNKPRRIKRLGCFPISSQPEAALMAFLHSDAGEGSLIPAESRSIPFLLPLNRRFNQSLSLLLLDGSHIVIKTCRRAEHSLYASPSSAARN